jgi:hypothetical protein
VNSFFFPLMILGFELIALHLLGNSSTTWGILQAPFCWDYRYEPLCPSSIYIYIYIYIGGTCISTQGFGRCSTTSATLLPSWLFFVFHFINIWNYMDWFSDAKPTLFSWHHSSCSWYKIFLYYSWFPLMSFVLLFHDIFVFTFFLSWWFCLIVIMEVMASYNELRRVYEELTFFF